MMNDDADFDDQYEQQIENMIAENGILLHALLEVLLQKGIITRDEIEAQIDRMASEMEET